MLKQDLLLVLMISPHALERKMELKCRSSLGGAALGRAGFRRVSLI